MFTYVPLRIRRTTVGDATVSTVYAPDVGLQVAIITDDGGAVNVVAEPEDLVTAEHEHARQVAILRDLEAR